MLEKAAADFEPIAESASQALLDHDAAAVNTPNRDEWLADVPAPHAWLEFEVEDVEQATAELEKRGYRTLVKNRKEPWGQTVSRVLAEGVLVGVAVTPSMRVKKAD